MKISKVSGNRNRGSTTWVGEGIKPKKNFFEDACCLLDAWTGIRGFPELVRLRIDRVSSKNSFMECKGQGFVFKRTCAPGTGEVECEEDAWV